jgi:hypothetical protein
MAGDRTFWTKVGEEVRSVADRTKRGALRAVQMGVLRVDLVSLRRDRSRALADLGEQLLRIWNAGSPDAIDSDAEALRLKSRIASIDDLIGAKQVELERLRNEAAAESDPAERPHTTTHESSKAEDPVATERR